MIDTVLFDLDGTLLPMNMETFMQAYFNEVERVFSDLMEPKSFIKYIVKATNYMISNLEPNKTNKEVFEEEFARLMGGDISGFMERFIHFYSTGFKKLKSIAEPHPLCREIVNTLVEKGYDVVLATNPLFPRIAIEERIKWAGIDISSFKVITTFEEMHFCKPNLEYYTEIMEIINKEPERCLMVGNDVEEDMVASRLGMKTFLLNAYVINRSGLPPQVDYQGGYEELLHFVRNCLPELGVKGAI